MINQPLKSHPTQPTFLLDSLMNAKHFYGESFNQNTKKPNYPFIYGIRNHYSILNTKLMALFLKRALKLIQLTLNKKQNILIIGNTPEIQFLLKRNFHRHQPHLFLFNQSWINGLLTNGKITDFFKQTPISLIIVLQTDTKESFLFKELQNLQIPVISLVNTYSNIQSIQYPLFTNYRNIQSLFFLMYLFRKSLCDPLL